MVKVALTGADGLVGSRIIELLDGEFDFIPVPQSQVDITDQHKVNEVIGNIDFDIFLHLAAYTNVPKAETEKDLVYKINRDGTKNVYDAVAKKDKNFIYISTDFVFDGKNPPYSEGSKPNPISVYAASKYEGEKIVKDKGMIVRIAYPYRASHEAKRDFMRTFKTYLEEKKPLTMITDSLMTPTFIDDIAYGLRYLFHNYSPEVFHLVGKRAISPYDAAVMVADKFGLDKSLIGKTTYEEYIKGKAPLPRLADIRSTKNDFLTMKTFGEGLEEIKKQL